VTEKSKFPITFPTTIPLIVLLWALLFLPNQDLRNLHFEEGRNALMALDMLRHGRLLAPEVLGGRFAENPQLFPLLIAAAARVTGAVDEWSVRLPTLLALLWGALLVRRFAARRGGPIAGQVAALCWLLNPFVMVHAIGEAHVLLSVLSFAAFAAWWHGAEAGHVGWRRWLLCGLLLTAVAAAKGPQPTAFFGLGVLGFTIAERRWRDLPGWVLALVMPAVFTLGWAASVYRPGDEGVWVQYMRLVHHDLKVGDYLLNQGRFVVTLALQFLPGTALAVVFWARRSDDQLARALQLYAGLCTCVLVLWPGANSRYAAPALPAVAVAAGLMAQCFWERRPLLLRAAAALLGSLALYRLVLALVVMPLAPDLFNRTRLAGETIGRAVAADPAPVLTLDPGIHSLAVYIGAEVRVADPDGLPAAAWLLAPPGAAAALQASRPGAAVALTVDHPRPLVLLRLR